MRGSDDPDGSVEQARPGRDTQATRAYRMRNVAVLTVLAIIVGGQAAGFTPSRRLQAIPSDPPEYVPVPSTTRPPPRTTIPTAPGDATGPTVPGTGAPAPGSTLAPAATLPPATTPTPTTAAPRPDDLSRAIPTGPPEPTPPAAAPPWAATTHTTAAGYVSTDVGCPGTSAGALDAFFAERVGPALGMDYQHVYPLGGDRYLWIFQDTFIDHGGAATSFSQSSFAHNAAMLQEGGCFSLLHRGSAARPASFEPGTGEAPLSTWFWPMGGELVGDVLTVFWVEMVADGNVPGPGDGLPWHPARTWLATYDRGSLQRASFQPAPDAGVSPVYGYAVASDDAYTYLFGNTFEQNLEREGGFWGRQHSATAMYLARVPRLELGAAPEYRTADGWSSVPGEAVAVSRRFWVENPMQPRYVAGQWVSAAKVDGYWGEELVIDVAADPWGPWTSVLRTALAPRHGDPLMNTYHAHVLPWLDGAAVPVCISQNARNMARDAWNHPGRYRLACFTVALVPPPATATPTTSTSTVPTTVDTTTTVATTTTVPATTTTTTAPTTTTTVGASSTTSTTAASTTTGVAGSSTTLGSTP